MPVTTRLTTLNLSYDSQIKKFAYKSAFILNSAVEHGDDCIYNKYPNTAFIPIPMNKIKMNVMYDMFMKYFKQYNTTNAYNSKFYAVSTWSSGVDGVTIIAVAEFPCEL